MGAAQVATAITALTTGQRGYQAVSLSAIDTTSVPSILAGSVVEVLGALFEWTSDEEPSGWSAITTATNAFVALAPSGSAGSQILSAGWVPDAPAWVAAHAAWYASSGSSSRVVARARKTGTNACWKAPMSSLGEMTGLVFPLGAWDMDAVGSVEIPHGLVASAIRDVKCIIVNDAGTAYTHFADHFFAAAGEPGYVLTITASAITVGRLAGGAYDATTYDSTASSRGDVLVFYTQPSN